MDFLKTYEGFLPYEQTNDLGDLFFEILKKKPEIYKQFLKDRRKDTSFAKGDSYNIDWFKHGLTDRMLKKLSHGTPSLSQAMSAQHYAFKKYRKWLKDNPALTSSKNANINNKIGIYESYEMDFLDATEVKPGMICDVQYSTANATSVPKVFQLTNNTYTAEVIAVFKGSDLFNLATQFKTFLVDKMNKLPKDRREVQRLNVYSYVKDNIDKKDRSKYMSKYFLLINVKEVDALKIVVYGKDEFNFTKNFEFYIPRWKVANRPILRDLNDKTGLFDE